jgi:hypothetical protein
MVTFLTRGDDVSGLQIEPDPVRGEIRTMDRRVQPPSAVVIPQMVIWASGLLATGEGDRFCGHWDVMVGIHDIGSPGKTKRLF